MLLALTLVLGATSPAFFEDPSVGSRFAGASAAVSAEPFSLVVTTRQRLAFAIEGIQLDVRGAQGLPGSQDSSLQFCAPGQSPCGKKESFLSVAGRLRVGLRGDASPLRLGVELEGGLLTMRRQVGSELGTAWAAHGVAGWRFERLPLLAFARVGYGSPIELPVFRASVTGGVGLEGAFRVGRVSLHPLAELSMLATSGPPLPNVVVGLGVSL